MLLLYLPLQTSADINLKEFTQQNGLLFGGQSCFSIFETKYIHRQTSHPGSSSIPIKPGWYRQSRQPFPNIPINPCRMPQRHDHECSLERCTQIEARKVCSYPTPEPGKRHQPPKPLQQGNKLREHPRKKHLLCQIFCCSAARHKRFITAKPIPSGATVSTKITSTPARSQSRKALNSWLAISSVQDLEPSEAR